jgi:hypothetical protein
MKSSTILHAVKICVPFVCGTAHAYIACCVPMYAHKREETGFTRSQSLGECEGRFHPPLFPSSYEVASISAAKSATSAGLPLTVNS